MSTARLKPFARFARSLRAVARRLAVPRRAVACGRVGPRAVRAAPASATRSAAGQPASRRRARTRAGLTADIFYRVILGDVALQRGETSLAARAYFEAARDARDPRLARRASEVALAARMRGLAQESAKLWATLDPAAERPKQILAALAAGGAARGKSAEPSYDNDFKVRLEKAIADAALTERGPGEIFLQLNRFCRRRARQAADVRARARAREALSEERRGALRGRARGLQRRRAGRQRRRDRARRGRPRARAQARLGARGAAQERVLARKKPDEAIAFLAQFVAANPDARSAAGALAQFYVEQKRYAEARAVFQRLWDSDRNAREFEFGVAVISVQMKDWDTAESLFQRPEARELRRQRRGRALPRADRRGDAAATPKRSSATRRSPKASAAGSRSCASPR